MINKTWAELKELQKQWYEKNGYDFLQEMIARLEKSVESVDNGRFVSDHVLLQNLPAFPHFPESCTTEELKSEFLEELISLTEKRLILLKAEEIQGFVGVYINGKRESIPGRILTFDEIVEYAGYSGNPTVTVRNPKGQDFTLTQGQTVIPENNMRFNVVNTDNA